MKKQVTNAKRKFSRNSKIICIFAAILFFVCAAMSAGYIVADAKVIDPWITQEPWTGGGGGGGGMPSVTVKFSSEHKNEVSHFSTVHSEMKSVTNSDGSTITVEVTSVNTDKYVHTQVYQRPEVGSAGSIDNVLYMIRELESYARDYLTFYQQPVSYNKINNLVLSYIRCIDASYTNMYSSWTDYLVNAWDAICGVNDRSFVGYVAGRDASVSGITCLQFFRSFIQDTSRYNSQDYSDVTSYGLGLKNTLADPLLSGQSIDLLHMFAALDGIFEYTEYSPLAAQLMQEKHNHQRDLISWLGDLQTFASEINRESIAQEKIINYSALLGHIDFNDFVNNNARPENPILSFSAGDMLADIDAMNIAKIFLDSGDNFLSDCIAAYYNEVNVDSSVEGNRYYTFLYTVTVESERSKNDGILENFRREVFNSMNLDYNNETCADHTYYTLNGIDAHLLHSYGSYPDFIYRSYAARLFYDYIIAMSHRF